MSRLTSLLELRISHWWCDELLRRGLGGVSTEFRDRVLTLLAADTRPVPPYRKASTLQNRPLPRPTSDSVYLCTSHCGSHLPVRITRIAKYDIQYA